MSSRLKGPLTYEQSIISRQTLMEQMPMITGERMARFRYQAEINPPEGYDEDGTAFNWQTPYQPTNDLEAAKLWITQYLLANSSTKRSQAAIYEVTFRNMAGA